MINKRRLTVVSMLFVLVTLAGCGGGGGGGGGGAPPTPTGSSNWDALVWDQGNWS